MNKYNKVEDNKIMSNEKVDASIAEEKEESVEAKKCDNIQVEIEQYAKEDVLPDGTLKPEAEFKYSVKDYIEAVEKQVKALERDIAAQEVIIEVVDKYLKGDGRESAYLVEIERDLDSRRKILQDAKIALQTMKDRIELYNSGIMSDIVAQYPLLVKLNELLNDPLHLAEYQEKLKKYKETL